MSKPTTNKEVRTDEEFYAAAQAQFLERLVKAIKEQLEQVKVSPEQLDNATKGIAFQVANVIDGTAHIKVGEKSVRSLLTFSEDPKGQKLIAPEQFSGMHAHTFKIAENLLKSTEKSSEKSSEKKAE